MRTPNFCAPAQCRKPYCSSTAGSLSDFCDARDKSVSNAVTEMSQLIEPALPEYLIPRLNYIKIAENEYGETKLTEIRNAVAALFYAENAGIEDLPGKLGSIVKLMRKENEDVIHHFFSWLLNYLENNDIG